MNREMKANLISVMWAGAIAAFCVFVAAVFTDGWPL